VTTAAPDTTHAEKTAPAADLPAKPKTRIARFALPQIDANSALLPSDKWIIDTAKEFLKTNKSLHKTAGKIAGFSALGLLGLGAGIAGAILLLPATLPVAGIALAAAAVTAFSGFEVHKQVKVFKTETLKELREHMGKKYLEYKMAELKAAWQRKADERARAKAAQKAAAAAQQAAAPTPESTAPKPSLTVVPPAEKPADKTAPKPEGGFGNWMLKKAMEKAQKKPDATPKTPPSDKPATDKPAAPKPPQP